MQQDKVIIYDENIREKAVDLSNKIKTLDLTANASFMDEFVKNLDF